ncbi:DUF421 domain-containing protein [Gorillibacterium sp. CAU 1737]|uniref:DUF421 domain-containing protein n=1 Tax=Gorillibacterium sp. CAU 1737 TaxID=3140362 RepID=UPI003260CD6E
MALWLEVTLRTLAAIVILFTLTKLLGKRQISQLTFFEYITGISIGSIAAYISLDLQTDWYVGLIALLVWTFVSVGIEFLQMKSKKARDFLDSKPTVLIKGGKIQEDNLKKERLTTDELMEQLRGKDVFRVADVEFALMEPSGDINVLLKRENQALTPKHLGIQVAPEAEPQAVILDGEIMDEGLTAFCLNRGWLTTELEKIGVLPENVFLGQVDAYGQLYVDLYDDKLKVPEPQAKAQLYAVLRKCEADLELFSLSTTNPEAKAMYTGCVKEINQVLAMVKPLLHT